LKQSTRKNKIFIGLEDIANIPMMFKKAFEENGFKCDYYKWSDLGEHHFGYGKDKTLFKFKSPPPFKIFGKNPFWLMGELLAVLYLFYAILRYNYFFFVTEGTFLAKNRDLKIIRFFKRKVIMMFTGCAVRDVHFAEADEDYICKRCLAVEQQIWCLCNETVKKKALVNRLESSSDKIFGQDDLTGYVEDKSKLLWFYIISDYPKLRVNLDEKFNQKEIRIIHFPSNPLVKQSHIIVPILNKFKNHEDVKIVIKEAVWERERVEEEISKAHILVNQLGFGYNTLPVEAMSYGCVVFNSNPLWFKRNVPEAPIVHITAETLEGLLEHFINNTDELRKYAEKSVEYYYKYHSPKAVGNHYSKILEL
jgi:hypothetical protein